MDPDAKESVTYLELAVAFQAKVTANVDSFGFGDKNKAVRVLSEALQTHLAHPPTKAKYLCYRAACLISVLPSSASTNIIAGILGCCPTRL